MTSISQANRPLQVTTPLGENALAVTGFRGREELSGLFSIELDLIAENAAPIDFSKIVGSELTLKVATPGEGSDTQWRYLSGICACFSQGDRDETGTTFYAEIVPRVWLLTRQVQSRIFQQKSVPDILKEVFQGFGCDFQLHGAYEPREYCVQYRESDFDFASRLMEEDGIYYFFKHSESGHQMVAADLGQSHLDVPGLTKARYDMIEGGPRKADHVFKWRKSQAIRPSRYSLRDHSFQQPQQNLEANARILPSVRAGSVEHHLNGQVNAPLEVYEFPGGYAVRFDGVNPSGGEQPSRLQKLFEENEKTAKLRIQAEAVEALKVVGTSSCRNFTAGHKFTLERHFDANGDYVLVSVTHEASLVNAYRSGSNGAELSYSNTFTCIPIQLPFRPPRKTPKPFVQGVQHAVVTGPPAEEIFTDKYGRVKVQFYWDRQGKRDANSSCWLRVGQAWAGKGWGSIQIPRIGQEVIVAFVEGNPDEPVIVGSVYNPETMPPYDLPGKKVVSGLKSNTHKGSGYNEMSMDDTTGQEKITIHSQYDMDSTVEHDHSLTVHNNHTSTVDGTHTETVKGDTTITIDATRTEKIKGDTSLTIDATYTEAIKGDIQITADATHTETIKGDTSVMITDGAYQLSTSSADISVFAATEILLSVGQSSILMKSDGTIQISGVEVTVSGTSQVQMGVGNQTVTSDTSQVAVSGASIASSATGKHEITGAIVKIN